MTETHEERKPPDDPPGANGSGGGGNAKERPKILYEDGFEYEQYKVLVTQSTSATKGKFLSSHKLGQALAQVTNNTPDILKKERLTRNKILVVCANAITANSLVNNETLSKDYNVFIPMNYVTRFAIIRDIDVEFTEDEILASLDTRQFKLMSVQRLKRKSVDEDRKVSYVPASTIKLSFAGQHIPAHVFLWYSRIPCEPYVQSTIQCFKCLKFGHTSNSCRSALAVCKKCYQKEEAEHSCSPTLNCLNCDGMHNPRSKNCPELQRQTKIKALMGSRNMCFQEAALLFPPMKKVSPSFAVKTSNAFSVLDNLPESFPTLGNPDVFDKDSPIEKYVAPPLPYKRQQQSSQRKINQTRKRDFVQDGFNSEMKKSKNEVKDKKVNTIAPLFYKRCAERKLETQKQSEQVAMSNQSFQFVANSRDNMSSALPTYVENSPLTTLNSNLSKNNSFCFKSQDSMDFSPSSPHLG
uniref:CCHC-type domain-containing protein n=1 Tax=Cacopsylla melanoneura TaxID=428564 RepID=A0A8D8Q0Y3_9HEMI